MGVGAKQSLDQQGKYATHAHYHARQHPLHQVRGIGSVAGALPLRQVGILTGRLAHQRAQVVSQHLGKHINQQKTDGFTGSPPKNSSEGASHEVSIEVI